MLSRMADDGILGGLSNARLEGASTDRDGDRVILVAVTERRTRADIERYATSLTKAIG